MVGGEGTGSGGSPSLGQLVQKWQSVDGWGSSPLFHFYWINSYYCNRKFFKYFSHLQRKGCKRNCGWGLRLVNWLDIPYTGYVEVDVIVLEQHIVGRRVLVVRVPSNATLQDRKVRYSRYESSGGVLSGSFWTAWPTALQFPSGEVGRSGSSIGSVELWEDPSCSSGFPWKAWILPQCCRTCWAAKPPVRLGPGMLTMVLVTVMIWVWGG